MTSIIIVTYKSDKQLINCLKSINELNINKKEKFEIIVIDNYVGSKIGLVLKKKFPKVKYFKNSENSGYGAANNFGVSKAKGEYVFILNPDTKLISGRIEKIINFIKKNKKVGAVAPLLVHENNVPFEKQGVKELTPKRAIFSLSFLSKLFPKNRIYQEYYNLFWNKKTVKEVEIVPGTAFVIKKEIFDRIGGFDPKFFLYFEEFDLCRRLIKLGYKNYITPELKIYHEWGASTSKNEDSEKHFLKSRFYYFKKNFGLLKTLLVESFLRINKFSVILFCILFLATFLRVYRLPDLMQFIGDTAWFFNSAKNLLIEGHIPLVGITTSHTWLHQGAFWTYILALILPVVKFNPIGAAYFTVALDIATLLAIYLFAKSYFNQKIALIASLFYATSPFLITSSQIPYHTNPISFLTILLIFSVIKWVHGSIKYFPVIIFITAVLYNFQISILPLGISVFLILIYGFLKKTEWAKNILNKKTLILSTAAFILPMIPMIIFDLSHGFSQTFKVGVWTFYRVAVFFGYPPINPEFGGETWGSFSYFIAEYIGKFYFMQSMHLAFIIFTVSIFFFLYKAKKSNFKNKEVNVILVFTFIPIISYIAAKTNSAAYIPMLIPQLVILLGFLFGSVKKKYFIFSVVIVILICVLNINSFYKLERGAGISKMISSARLLSEQSYGEPYNIIVTGSGSQFESFGDNYKYLAWWIGSPSSENDEKLKFYVESISDKIIIKKVIIK